MRLMCLFAVTASATGRYVVGAAAANSSAFVISPKGVVSPPGVGLDESAKQALHNSSSGINTTEGSRMLVDKEYPGTAVQRMNAVHERVAQLARGDELNGRWEEVRRKLLWAGGLRDLPNAVPGQGYTGHSFNDYNHVDLATMNDQVSDNQNEGQVRNIAIGNRLGDGIRIASLPELGPGGSWTTCANGCNVDPPQDVAHIQFRSRIAFKLVWAPLPLFDTFVLVDDDGKLLAQGTPSDGPGGLPNLRERQRNYQLVQGSKYAIEADRVASIITQE